MNAQQVAALIGALLPVLVSVVVRSSWPGWLKGITAASTSVTAGTATAFFAGQFTGVDVLTCIGVALGASQVAYMTFWQPTGIGKAIERATQPTIDGQVVRSETVPLDE